jgi:hypothetical protein
MSEIDKFTYQMQLIFFLIKLGIKVPDRFHSAITMTKVDP